MRQQRHDGLPHGDQLPEKRGVNAIDRGYPDAKGRLAVECWCRKAIVWIKPEKVGIETASCGARNCKAPT